MKLLIRFFLLAGLALSFSSCSRLNWAVRFADFYLVNQIDDFLDLSGAQKKETKNEVQKVLLRIRAEDFPKLADFLDRAASGLRVAEPLEKKWLDDWNEEILALVMGSLRRFEPLALSLQASMSDEQEENFRKEFARRTEKLRREVSSPDRALKKDRERTLRWVEFFVTDLTWKQRKTAEDFVKDHPTDFQAELRNREHLASSFHESRAESRKAWIEAFMKDPDALRPRASVEATRKRQEAMKSLFMELWNDLSEKQRTRVRDNLKEKAAEFRRLSK